MNKKPLFEVHPPLIIVIALSLVLPGAIWAGEGAGMARFGVVDVSSVFKNYRKVPDVQRQVNRLFDPRRKALENQRKELMELGEKIGKIRRELSGRSEFLFDQVQFFQKQQFLYEKRSRKLDNEFVDRMRQDMKEVLNDIRAAINSVAESRKLQLVLRSADADNLKVLEPPKEKVGDGKTEMSELDKKVANILDPKSTVEVVGRFKRNPVLYGAKVVDITEAVLKKLNETYMR